MAWASPAELWVAAGQLGTAVATAVVAWLVYRNNRGQARRAQALAARQHALDLQAFRLSLLERRLAVFAMIEKVYQHWLGEARPDPEIMKVAIRAIDEAQMIFDENVVTEIREVATLLMRLQRSEARRRNALGKLDEAEALRLAEKSAGFEDQIFEKIQPLRDAVKAATRIEEKSPNFAAGWMNDRERAVVEGA